VHRGGRRRRDGKDAGTPGAAECLFQNALRGFAASGTSGLSSHAFEQQIGAIEKDHRPGRVGCRKRLPHCNQRGATMTVRGDLVQLHLPVRGSDRPRDVAGQLSAVIFVAVDDQIDPALRSVSRIT
jgi:hypothetical protein